MKRLLPLIAALLFLTGGINFHAPRAGAVVDAQEAFLKRSSEYESLYPVELDESSLKFIIDNCATIKQKVVKSRESVNNTTVIRENAYGSIEKQLSAIQSRLSAQGLDTSVIDLVLASYRIEVSNFKNSADKYLTILTDAASIDCENKPKLFKSAVLATRDYRYITVEAMKRIKNVYNSSVLNGFDLLERQIYEK